MKRLRDQRPNPTRNRRTPLIGAAAIVFGLTVVAAVSVFASERAPLQHAPKYLQPHLEAATSQQDAALADGLVDESEYRQAFERYAQCAEEAGARVVHGPEWSEALSDFEVWVEIQTAESTDVEPAVDTCWREHVGVVQDVWNWQQQGSPSEDDLEAERLAVRERINACLESHGIDPGEGTPEDLARAFEENRPVFKACVLDGQDAENR